jgi:hypothetical protein
MDTATYIQDVVRESRLHVQQSHPLHNVAQLFELAASSKMYASALLSVSGEDAKFVLDSLQLVS